MKKIMRLLGMQKRLLYQAGGKKSLLEAISRFYQASLENDIERAKNILDAFPDNHPEILNLSMSLHAAVKFGHIDFVCFLIDAKADLNFLSPDGQTALNVAVTRNKTDIAMLLIRAGADIMIDDAFYTMLAQSLNKKFKSLAIELLLRGANIDKFILLLAAKKELFDIFLMIRFISQDCYYTDHIKASVVEKIAYYPELRMLAEMSLDQLMQTENMEVLMNRYPKMGEFVHAPQKIQQKLIEEEEKAVASRLFSP
ncbi:MAG: ankyrin repeat domain-containing protein [Gammaproteobacteria bacterium]|nr:ankyrin repeat domain-containing protein [Gammaproteobacteria bacterium]